MPMVTKVLYRDCGLITACFKGFVQLFDQVDFHLKGTWDNDVSVIVKEPKPAVKKDEVKKCVVSVECLDYSAKLDLIAFGGVSGHVVVLDSQTLSFKGKYRAAVSDVNALFFNDPELQMITVSLMGDVSVWDA